MFGDRKDIGWTKEDYLRQRNRSKKAIIIMAVLTLVLSLYSLSLTQYPISFTRMIEILVGALQGYQPTDYYEQIEYKVILENYVPRITAGLAVGAILGISGAVMQSVIHNPLADPYTTGISSGAAFGVAIFTVFGLTLIPGVPGWERIINAFIFAMIPCALIILFASMGKGTSTTMILVGIAVMMIFSSATQLVMFAAEPSSYGAIYEWNIGSLRIVENQDVPFILASLIILCVSMVPLSKYVTVMTAGDRMATCIGVNAKLIRVICFTLVSGCTAIAVSFTGSIGFIGLVIPHICRLIVGSSKGIIALSGIIGALMLMCCDAVARLIVLGGLPVGVITAAVGSPVFIYFLIRSRKNSYYG